MEARGRSSADPTLHILEPARVTLEPAATLIVLIHGFRGSPQRTWGRTAEFLVQDTEGQAHVWAARYPSFGGRDPKDGAEVLADRIALEIVALARACGYRQVGIAGHSLGGLVAAVAMGKLLEEFRRNERRALVPTALCCCATPWSGLRSVAKTLAAACWWNPQARDLWRRDRAVRTEARGAYTTANQHGIECSEVIDARDGVVARSRAILLTAQRWLGTGHIGSARVRSRDDRVDREKYRPLLAFARAACGASILEYLRTVGSILADWDVRRIVVDTHAGELYADQQIVPQRINGGDDPVSRHPAGQGPRPLERLLKSEAGHAFLSGPAGVGKTTAVVHLAKRALDAAMAAPRAAAIPVVARLDGRSVTCGPSHADGLIALRPPADPERPDKPHLTNDMLRAIAERERTQPLLMLIDGLDEGSETERALVMNLQLRLSNATSRLVVAGRPPTEIRTQQWTVWSLLPPDPGRLVDRYLPGRADSFRVWMQAADPSLLRNPGHAMMLMLVFAHSGRREAPATTIGDLYKLALPYAMARDRKHPQPLDAEAIKPWKDRACEARRQLGLLAYESLRRRDTKSASNGGGIDPVRIGETLLGQLENADVLRKRLAGLDGIEWHFGDERWREYFASVELRGRCDAAQDLREVARPSWMNVWRFAALRGEVGASVQRAAAQISPVLELIVAAARQDRDAARNAFALLEAHDPRVVRTVTGFLGETTGPTATLLLSHLSFSDKASARAAAAMALGGTADPAALQALVGLIRDPDADVQRAAAWALGGTADPAALQALVGLV
ncbi:MAG: HEAT repeat domain-containing protein, partial [Actinobacteria bacterium]|nr:HEAT repeat domain-containing protein [Actinomycetota bacterium]